MKLRAENVGYWYFRLNGFLSIANFVVHDYPRDDQLGAGAQRTEVDLLGVRFPNRSEGAVEAPASPMEDDTTNLDISENFIEFVIVDMTKGRRCKFNRAWTDPNRQNMQRILSAIGCVPTEYLKSAAEELYACGSWSLDRVIRVRLVAVGSAIDPRLMVKLPGALQVTWRHLVEFVYDRLKSYQDAKSRTSQWDECGTELRKLARREESREAYVGTVLNAMGVR